MHGQQNIKFHNLTVHWFRRKRLKCYKKRSDCHKEHRFLSKKTTFYVMQDCVVESHTHL